MSRYELVNEFNYYTRKRDCYEAKIQKNNELITLLEDALANCNTYMQELEVYDGEAEIFRQLYEKNNEYFDVTEKARLLGILSSAGEHLSSEKESAQEKVNYWYAQIQAYDKEQEEKMTDET